MGQDWAHYVRHQRASGDLTGLAYSFKKALFKTSVIKCVREIFYFSEMNIDFRGF